MLRLLVFGHAPPWAAFVLWLVVGTALVLLWRGIRDQDQRERAERRSRLDDHADWLREHETRLQVIEDHLSINPSREGEQ